MPNDASVCSGLRALLQTCEVTPHFYILETSYCTYKKYSYLEIAAPMLGYWRALRQNIPFVSLLKPYFGNFEIKTFILFVAN